MEDYYADDCRLDEAESGRWRCQESGMGGGEECTYSHLARRNIARAASTALYNPSVLRRRERAMLDYTYVK